MKLLPKPRIVYMVDPDYGNRPYPFPLAGLSNTFEAMALEVFNLNPATATLESFRSDIERFKPELLFGFIQHRRQIAKISGFLKKYHPIAVINWYVEDPNGIIGAKDDINVIEPLVNFSPKIQYLYESTFLCHLFPANDIVVELIK